MQQLQGSHTRSVPPTLSVDADPDDAEWELILSESSVLDDDMQWAHTISN
jgi:hypothetical protein